MEDMPVTLSFLARAGCPDEKDNWTTHSHGMRMTSSSGTKSSLHTGQSLNGLFSITDVSHSPL